MNKTKMHPLLRRFFSPPIRATAVVLGLAVVVILILELADITHIFHSQKLITSTIPTTSGTKSKSPASKASPLSPNSKGSLSDSSNPKSNSSSSSSSSAAADLKVMAPYGSFVSNHYPGQNGSPLTEESVCNTTPGVSCYIKFTKGNVVKSLPTQTTDTGGATSWSWSISKAGLTSGLWQVTAVASWHDQTKTTNDPISLEVK